MIDLYAAETPAGRSITVMLEETECAYTVTLVKPEQGGQLPPDLLEVSPDGAIPAITDRDDSDSATSIIGSDPILRHLAERSGRLLPEAGPERSSALHWLDWHTNELEPTLSRLSFPRPQPHGDRGSAASDLTDQAIQQFSLFDAHLAQGAFVGGDSFSIADIAIYASLVDTHDALALSAGCHWTHVRQWMKRMSLRPAVGRGMAALG